MESRLGLTTFIVRLSRDEAGRLIGLVERVRTGQKERFHGLEEIARVIARMVAPEPNHEKEETP